MKLIEHIPLIKQMEILNRLSFFREFSLNERQVLLESFSHLYLINKDRFVFKQFDNDKQLYIVLSGAIVVFKHSHLMDLGTIEPGEFIGEGAFINNRGEKPVRQNAAAFWTPEGRGVAPRIGMSRFESIPPLRQNF